MEYPTITLITTSDSGQNFDATIVHEIGHNWFYGVLASNERQHPWMDEGMNTFYQKRYELQKYGTYGFLQAVPANLRKKLPDDEEKWLLNIMAKIHKDQPIETPSTKFNHVNYGLVAYYKASRWMKKLEDELGTALFDSCMRQYYREWSFRHPYPEDFKWSMEKNSGKDLNHIFIELHNSGSLSYHDHLEKKKLKPSFLFNFKDTEKYNYLNIAPAIGFNAYDKMMLGALVHNYTLPPTNFQFIAGAMYATGSSALNGFGRAGYTKYARGYKLEGAVSYINFTQNQFPQDDPSIHLGMRRIVPSLELTKYDKDATSTRRYSAHWQTFLIKEDQLDFRTEQTPAGPIDVIDKKSNDRYVNRLSLSISDNRILYPYSFTLSTDQGEGFVRTGLTGKYFFNYADGKSGISARLFAGKFFYTVPRTFLTRFQNDRYALNMTGPVGREDYTYSNYYIGRNKFEGTGWMSQQIMERDGFFKIRTQQREIGSSDDWLMALNIVTDLPGKYNPLSVLPIKIPLKIFVDIGTYADAWQEESSTGRFMYDAGLQVPLFNSLVNIYIPILYSSAFRDYVQSITAEKKFARTISFNIDIDKLQVKNLVKNFPL
nr:M1 family aminopeptidase [Aridibaculum aurantiacum]